MRRYARLVLQPDPTRLASLRKVGVRYKSAQGSVDYKWVKMISPPAFSENEDVEALQEKLTPLLTINGGKWRISANGKGLERPYKFKTFKKTWEFMNAVAAECALKRHHPEWSNVYNTTFIRWTTHSPPGLSSKDVMMASFCDQTAATFGEIEPPTEEDSQKGKDLADTVAAAGGDCCIPKSKS